MCVCVWEGGGDDFLMSTVSLHSVYMTLTVTVTNSNSVSVKIFRFSWIEILNVNMILMGEVKCKVL